MIKQYIDLYAVQIKVILFVLLLGASFAGGFWLKSTMVEASHAKDLKAEIEAKEKAQKMYNELSKQVLEAVGKNDVIHTKTIEKQYKEVEKPVYEACIIPESGIIIQNDQIRELNKQIRGEK